MMKIKPYPFCGGEARLTVHEGYHRASCFTCGNGTRAYMALRMDRRAIGIELKDSYYNQAVANCEVALTEPIIDDLDGEKEEPQK